MRNFFISIVVIYSAINSNFQSSTHIVSFLTHFPYTKIFKSLCDTQMCVVVSSIQLPFCGIFAFTYVIFISLLQNNISYNIEYPQKDIHEYNALQKQGQYKNVGTYRRNKNKNSPNRFRTITFKKFVNKKHV